MGGGHDAAGRAIEEELKRRGHSVTFLNPYSLVNRKVENRINKAYVSTAQKAPEVFGCAYKVADVYRKLPGRSPIYYVNKRMIPVMREYLDSHHFDVAIMPHLFPAEILTAMKRNGMNIPHTIFISTDYTCIPFTEETDCDYYIIASEDLTDEYISRGIPKDKLKPYGIPVGSSFSKNSDRKEIAEKLGLDPGKRYILLSGGSIGAGQQDKTAGFLDSFTKAHPDIKAIVVCGNNERLYNKLTDKYKDNLIILRRTNNMADYMRLCEVFITKPGGLSSTEAAVSHAKTLHISPIPGCENKNIRFFSGRGMSVALKRPGRKLERTLEKLLESDGKEMENQQKKYIPDDAAVRICNLAESLIK